MWWIAATVAALLAVALPARHRLPGAPPGRRLRRMRRDAHIRAQLLAARAYAPTVAELEQTSHRYTAGQAAALAWLLNLAPDPLAYRPRTARPRAGDVVDLADRAQAAIGPTRAAGITDHDGEAPAPYLLGILQVCQWVLRETDAPPFPAPARAGADADLTGVRRDRPSAR